jgi:hypothetical protein
MVGIGERTCVEIKRRILLLLVDASWSGNNRIAFDRRIWATYFVPAKASVQLALSFDDLRAAVKVHVAETKPSIQLFTNSEAGAPELGCENLGEAWSGAERGLSFPDMRDAETHEIGVSLSISATVAWNQAGIW